MAITLQKGGNVSLSKSAPGLTKIFVGLGWDVRATSGDEFDLDASAFLLTDQGKVRNDNDFIFYNQTISTEGSVEHMGDNRTGAGEGDDEVIKVDLDKVPREITKLLFTVSIYEAEKRHQNFGMVSSAVIRVVSEADGVEIARYDLSEDASTETAMIFGEVYRYNNEWKFRAVGQGFNGGFAALVKNFGVNV
ncbi:MAG: TerD family protein [Chloroflexota bacterium]|nr:TerD family protein [Chloroflexota bacterium]